MRAHAQLSLPSCAWVQRAGVDKVGNLALCAGSACEGTGEAWGPPAVC